MSNHLAIRWPRTIIRNHFYFPPLWAIKILVAERVPDHASKHTVVQRVSKHGRTVFQNTRISLFKPATGTTALAIISNFKGMRVSCLDKVGIRAI